MTVLKFQELKVPTQAKTGVVTSWFINTMVKLCGIAFSPRESLYLQSNKTDGPWDELFSRITEVGAFDKLLLTVTSINIHANYNGQAVVVDPELDALLKAGELPPEFVNKNKNKVVKAPVFAYINVEISCIYIKNSTLKGSMVVRVDAPKAVLSALLAESKNTEPCAIVDVVGLINPRIKKEIILLPLDF